MPWYRREYLSRSQSLKMNAVTSKALTRIEAQNIFQGLTYLKFHLSALSSSLSALSFSLLICQSYIQSVLLGHKQTSSYVLFKSVSRLEYSSWSLCFSFASSVFIFTLFFVDIARKYFHQHNIHTNCMYMPRCKGSALLYSSCSLCFSLASSVIYIYVSLNSILVDINRKDVHHHNKHTNLMHIPIAITSLYCLVSVKRKACTLFFNTSLNFQCTQIAKTQELAQ